jgi:hypothetical protein
MSLQITRYPRRGTQVIAVWPDEQERDFYDSID